MYVGRIGGIIAAGSKSKARPMAPVGEISAIERVIFTFRQAGVFPIAVITGADVEKVRYRLSSYGVVFLPLNKGESPQLFDSIRLGLSHLNGKCERAFVTPVNTPVFTHTTLLKLSQAKGDILIPAYRGAKGHPVLLSKEVIPEILSYQGEGGLSAAIQNSGRASILPVEDEGILLSVHDEEEIQKILEAHNHSLLRPSVKIEFKKERSFYNARLKLLLFLISDVENVKRASRAMALSEGKAWEMINALEIQLGYPVVERQQGGRKGGKTRLTEKGEVFLCACQRMEEEIYRCAIECFEELFVKTGIL